MNDRRRRLFVNRPVQVRIVKSVAKIPLLVLLGTAIVVTITTGQVFDEATARGVELLSLNRLTFSLLLCIVSAGAAMIAQAALHSHRVAGPMHRLVQSMRRMRTGDLDFDVTLRSKDELKELATELNETIGWLRNVLGTVEPSTSTRAEVETGEPAAPASRLEAASCDQR